MSRTQPPHLASTEPALFSSTARLAQTTNQPSTAKLDVAHLLADDPAVLIGLALAYVCHQSRGAGAIPEPVLSRLTAHAGQGDPACRLVLSWLNGRQATALVSDPNADRPEQSSRSSTFGARKSLRDRVMERLGGPPTQSLQPRGRKRSRWPLSTETKAGVGPETVSANEEGLSHG